MTDSKLIAESIQLIFEEMIMNMTEKEQFEARLIFDEIINKHILLKIRGKNDTTECVSQV